MRGSLILVSLLAATMSSAFAENNPAMPGNHDHAAMMRGMGAKQVAWTGYPLLKTSMGGMNREARVIPQNISVERIAAFSNRLEGGGAPRQLPVEMGGVKLDKPDSGGFHWLAAREEEGGMVHVASTVYYFGERGSLNPTVMFMRQKNELEIIPQPFPREHSRYRADEDWKFLVRFNGQPLASQKVNVETSNGSRFELLTDATGMLSLHVPDDFKAEEESRMADAHGHGKPAAEFVLATTYGDGGKTYLTAFNSSYGNNAFDQRSLAMGLGFMLLGMLGALPLLRQRNSGKPAANGKNEEA